jgi:hypothetical protein
MRLANTFVPVKRPCRLVTKRNDAGTPPFAHHVRFAPLNAYVFGFQSRKLGAADTRIKEKANDGEITPCHEILPIASLAKGLDLLWPQNSRFSFRNRWRAHLPHRVGRDLFPISSAHLKNCCSAR